jgi:hypothetical protein
MKRRWCGSSWPAEAFGSPCHEGAGDLGSPNVTKPRKREKREVRRGFSREMNLLKKYRDAERDILGWGWDGESVSGRLKGRW